MSLIPPFGVEELNLPGVLKITPKVFTDARGLSSTVYSPEAFAQIGISSSFAQDYFSRSKKGVIRGLHFQHPPFAQDKLVRCAHGKILDVVVDPDSESTTYGKSVTVTLQADEQVMLFIPGRYAHGFCVLSDEAVVEYKMSAAYHPEAVGGVRYDDPIFGIKWPEENLLLSDQDSAWQYLSATQGRRRV